MALVLYSETLPRMIHDEVMKALESAIGQNAKDFSDVLFRTIMADGRNALEVIHREGFIKKVPTSQILITPTMKSSVRLDELNNILDEMDKGDAALKRLSDIDKEAGMVGQKKRVREGREVGMPPNNTSMSRTNLDVDANASAAAYVKGVLTDAALSDSDIAADRLSQAEAMQKQAMSLLAEAQRLTDEAKSLTPAKNAKTTRAKKAAPAKKQAS
jgi:murein L,D-transpeptidase YcbB/YkuD